MKSMNRVLSVGILSGILAMTFSGTASAEPIKSAPSVDRTAQGVADDIDSLRGHYSDKTLFLNPEKASNPTLKLHSESSLTRKGSWTIVCTINADNPHVSSGAGKKGKKYVIYKSRVVCSGTGSHPSHVTVQVRGALYFNPSSSRYDTSHISWRKVKTSKESRVIAVDGKKKTFYTPRNGQVGAKGKGHFQGNSILIVTSPKNLQRPASKASYVSWFNV